MVELIRRRQQRVDELAYRLAHAERDVLERKRRRFEALGATVRHYDLRRVLAGMRRELEERSEAMAGAARNLLLQQRGRLERIGAALEALSPVAILERGYALVFDAEGKLVKDPGQVRAGDAIVARLAKGRVRARVEGTE